MSLAAWRIDRGDAGGGGGGRGAGWLARALWREAQARRGGDGVKARIVRGPSLRLMPAPRPPPLPPARRRGGGDVGVGGGAGRRPRRAAVAAFSEAGLAGMAIASRVEENPMSFHIPEHVQETRERVRRFVEEKCYPAERLIESRGDEKGREIVRGLMSEAKEAGLWALGHPKEIGGQRHAVPRLRVRERGRRPLRARDGGARHALAAGLDHAASRTRRRNGATRT